MSAKSIFFSSRRLKVYSVLFHVEIDYRALKVNNLLCIIKKFVRNQIEKGLNQENKIFMHQSSPDVNTARPPGGFYCFASLKYGASMTNG